MVVDCEGGWLVIPDYTSARMSGQGGRRDQEVQRQHQPLRELHRGRAQPEASDLHADILEGHLSSALCHTGNISYRLGKTQSPEEMRDAVKANKDLAEALGRMEQHLAANHVDLKKTPATLGAVLKMDPQAEQFIGNAKPNSC